jgi:hypothetical protein
MSKPPEYDRRDTQLLTPLETCHQSIFFIRILELYFGRDCPH